MRAWSLAGPDWAYHAERLRRAERMDDPHLAPHVRADALSGLERIATWPGQRAPLLRELLVLLGPPGPRRLRLVEVGAGSGSMSRWIQAQLEGRGYRAELLATDRVAAAGVRRLDALGAQLPDADVYFSNLFLHHLPDDKLSAMLKRQAKASRLGLLHFDLHRHWAHFYGAVVVIRAARLPRINLVDGLSSIQQGYTRAELQSLGSVLPGVEVRWSFPFRWMLQWRRP